MIWYPSLPTHSWGFPPLCHSPPFCSLNRSPSHPQSPRVCSSFWQESGFLLPTLGSHRTGWLPHFFTSLPKCLPVREAMCYLYLKGSVISFPPQSHLSPFLAGLSSQPFPLSDTRLDYLFTGGIPPKSMRGGVYSLFFAETQCLKECLAHVELSIY